MSINSNQTFYEYQIYRKIGQGGFGDVYLAKHIENNQFVAIKRISKTNCKEKPAVRERDIMVENRNENEWMVKIHSSFQGKKYLYMVMEYIEGGDLKSFSRLCKRKNNPFSINEIKLYLAQIVNSVSKVHQMEYLHRDIKPENIFIKKNGDVVLGDFGTAKKFESIQGNPEKGGTVAYSPPEVFNGENYDKGSDWWSVGCVLYQLFTNEILFGHCIGIDQINKKYYLENKKSSKIPADATDLLERMLDDKEIRIGEEEIKNHPFFKDIDWSNLYNRGILKIPEPMDISMEDIPKDFYTDIPVDNSGIFFKGYTFNPPFNYKSKTSNFDITSLSLFFLLLAFFLSPLLYKNNSIGMQTKVRTIVRYFETVGNVYEYMQYYLEQDDYFIIQETIVPPSFNDSNFFCYESIMLKYEVLYSLNNNTKYPTYIIPKGLATCVYPEKDSTFTIRITTYEKDNKLKVYKKSNVPRDSFEILEPENNLKNKIISRFGNHYLKQNFIIIQNLSPLQHYIISLKIQFNRIKTFFLTFTKHFDNYNNEQGFDNFGDISQIDNLNKNL